MDLASLIGFIGAIGAIIATMIMGGGVAPFIDTQSIFIVFGGTFFCVMYQNPLPVFLGSFGAMSKAFLPPIKKMDETVERMVELAAMARKDGMMALEGQPVPDKFFEKGMQMLVDGADEQVRAVAARDAGEGRCESRERVTPHRVEDRGGERDQDHVAHLAGGVGDHRREDHGRREQVARGAEDEGSDPRPQEARRLGDPHAEQRDQDRPPRPVSQQPGC